MDNMEGACPSCGGSGVLRTNGASYRTCLDCVGQGALPRFEANFEANDELSRAMARAMGRGVSRGFRGDLSAWTSGAR
ncbi:MAG: hypothetical protein RLZZ533_1782 [Cyanobacteriota bacterium]|jgi:hypothetical protein